MPQTIMIDLLKNLIKIESDSKQGANEALVFCAGWLSEKEVEFEIFENNGYKMLVASKGNGDETIVWNGHIDVVPGHDEQFVPMIERDKLYGRGAADMKAGVAAMMQAFAELDERKLERTVQLHIVTDEEIGGRNTSKWLVSQGYHGDFVICGEPTGLKIGLQSKGILHIDLTFKGKPAHGSRPWEGVNAIEQAMKFHFALSELPFRKDTSAYFDQPSVNLAFINAGDRYNVVPELCTMKYDIRFMPGQTVEEILEQISGLIDTLELDAEFETGEAPTPALTTKEDNPYILSLQQAVREVTSREPALFGQHGAADTRYYAEVNGGEGAIEFGPAGDDWHGNAEYGKISTIQQFKEILLLHAYGKAEVSRQPNEGKGS